MTTLPDTNVRPAQRAAAGSARAAGQSLLARLLLFVLQHLSKLDRKLLLLLVASPMSACIIPAGPEFQDPIGVPDSPPYLVAVSPDQGLTVARDDPFVVQPGDLNVDDPIFVKWITEFPPFVPNVTNDLMTDPIAPSADGSPTRRPSKFTPSCTRVNPFVSAHQIVALISDRPFTSAGLVTTESTFKPIQVSWTWQQTCQVGSQ